MNPLRRSVKVNLFAVAGGSVFTDLHTWSGTEIKLKWGRCPWVLWPLGSGLKYTYLEKEPHNQFSNNNKKPLKKSAVQEKTRSDSFCNQLLESLTKSAPTSRDEEGKWHIWERGSLQHSRDLFAARRVFPKWHYSRMGLERPDGGLWLPRQHWRQTRCSKRMCQITQCHPPGESCRCVGFLFLCATAENCVSTAESVFNHTSSPSSLSFSVSFTFILFSFFSFSSTLILFAAFFLPPLTHDAL